LAGLFVAADGEHLPAPGPGDAEERINAQQPGVGAGTSDHVLPLNCSVRVVMVPSPFCLWPTAQISLADTAAMPNSELPVFPWPTPALGVFTSDQVLPSQCSTDGTW
jgi:hypothetical protein